MPHEFDRSLIRGNRRQHTANRTAGWPVFVLTDSAPGSLAEMPPIGGLVLELSKATASVFRSADFIVRAEEGRSTSMLLEANQGRNSAL